MLNLIGIAPDGAEAHDTFRNELASISTDGRRRWIYARQPSGRYYRARTMVSVGLLAFLLGAPFVTLGGQPLMLLNVLERRFVLLGVPFPPQDFALVVLVALSAIVSVLLATVVVGRVWCGWMCPQTIFMEMLFRKLEYLIEGSAEQQLRRDRGPWTTDKLLRKAGKHAVFFVLSFVIANVFLAWIIGAGPLRAIVTDLPARHLGGLSAIMLFTSVFYLVFARFREQACVLACPYGRMMSALVDARTVTVTYDRRRGEPRGRLSASASTAQTGDCIDCHRCVTVCPTGIDIRNGVQLECVSCTACIDACDDVMARVGRAPGLIRHASAAEVWSGARQRRLTARVAAYTTVWLLLVGALAFLLVTRPGLDVLILRQSGTLYVTLPGGELGNFYTVQALNRTGQPAAFELVVLEPPGATMTALGPLGPVAPHAVLDSRVLLRVPPSGLIGPSTPVRVQVRLPGGGVQMVESAFLGPAAVIR